MQVSWLSYFYVFALLGVLAFCLISKKKVQITSESEKIIIQGMTCSHCESSVEHSLLQLKGIQSVQASHSSGEVFIKGSNYKMS